MRHALQARDAGETSVACDSLTCCANLQPPFQVSSWCFRSRYATAAAAAQTAEAAKQQQQHAPAEGSPQLQLYNTMARTKQPFHPGEGQGNRVSMYVCGVTVYDW